MRKSLKHILKSAVCLCVTAALACSLCACGEEKKDERAAGKAGPDFVIYEQDVTDYITEYRTFSGISDDEKFKEWLEQRNTTSEALRKEVINQLATLHLVESAAADQGVTVSDGDVNARVSEKRETYPSDIAWNNALISSGFTEQGYRDQVKSELLKEGLKAHFTNPNVVSDDELEDYMKSHISGTNAHETSAIFVESKKGSSTRMSAKAKAQQAKKDLDAGKSFDEVFRQYSDTTYSEDGQMGFDMFSVPSVQYREALTGMEKGDISDVVEADEGYFVIQCTDHYMAPEYGVPKMSDIPQGILDGFREQCASNQTDSQYGDYLTERVTNVEVAVYAMPDDLPYAVDRTEQN